MGKGGKGGGNRQAVNNRADSMNPNNAAYHASASNRSNQMNPNNPAYQSSRSGTTGGGNAAASGGGTPSTTKSGRICPTCGEESPVHEMSTNCEVCGSRLSPRNQGDEE